MINNSIIVPNKCCLPVSTTEQCLKKDKYLLEFETDAAKRFVRDNLEVYSKLEVDKLIKSFTDMMDPLELQLLILTIVNNTLSSGYVKSDGSVPFIKPEKGITPFDTLYPDNDYLVTKEYVKWYVDNHSQTLPEYSWRVTGINCLVTPSSGKATEGTIITILATANEGYSFDGKESIVKTFTVTSNVSNNVWTIEAVKKSLPVQPVLPTAVPCTLTLVPQVLVQKVGETVNPKISPSSGIPSDAYNEFINYTSDNGYWILNNVKQQLYSLGISGEVTLTSQSPKVISYGNNIFKASALFLPGESQDLLDSNGDPSTVEKYKGGVVESNAVIVIGVYPFYSNGKFATADDNITSSIMNDGNPEDIEIVTDSKTIGISFASLLKTPHNFVLEYASALNLSRIEYFDDFIRSWVVWDSYYYTIEDTSKMLGNLTVPYKKISSVDDKILSTHHIRFIFE